MNKKLYTSIVALTLLFGAGVVTSYAVSSRVAPAIVPSGVPEERAIQPRNPDISVVFDLKDGKPYLKATLTVPTLGTYPDTWEDVALTTVKKVELKLQGASYSDPPTVLKTWENCTPGETLTYDIEDPTMEIGKEYTYIATATQDIESYGNRCYAKFALNPKAPETPRIAESADGTKLEVTYVCPTAEMNIGSPYSPEYVPLPEGVTITKVELYTKGASDSEVILASHANPEPGQEFKYIDENPTPGAFNNYYVRSCTDYGNSGGAYNSYFFGDDFPAKIPSLTATEKGGKVELTWEAPTAGYNGGRFDPSKTVYAVYRMYDNYGSGMQLLVDNLKETTYTDGVEDLTEEKMLWYRIVPSNDIEADQYAYNYAETSNGLLVGPPAALPFVETFNSGTKFNKKFDRLWQTEFDWSFFSDYYIRNDLSSVAVSGDSYLDLLSGTGGGNSGDENGYDAFFYVTPATYYQNLGSGMLATGSLSFTDATNPMISFWYVPINDNSGQVTVEINKGELDGEGNAVWEEVGVQLFDDPTLDKGVVTTELKWQKVSFPLTKYAGTPKAKLRLRYEYTTLENRYAMPVDMVTVDDYPAVTGLAVEDGENDSLVLTWNLPESAGEKKATYNVYKGSEKIASTEEKTYTFAGAEQGESYSFAVEAVYEDGTIAPKCEAVEYTVPLSSFVVDGVKYFVADSDVYASGFVGEGDAVVIPAKVSYKEKEYEVVSLSAEFLKGNRTVKSVEVAAEVESVPESFCYGCVALKSVKLPASVKEISDKAFFGCAELSGLELPEAVAKVGASAFEHCEAIAEITFGQDLAEIGAAAFKGAKSLAKVTFKGDVPPTVAADAFSGIASPCEGVCPEGKEADYAAVEGLKPISFATNAIFDIMSGNVAEVEYFNLSGARIAAPARGEAAVARVRLHDGTVKTVKVIGK